VEKEKQMIDLLIRNGWVVDGLGDPEPYAPWVRADVAVADGRIVRVGTHDGEEVRTTIDAAGLIVAPGFIDIHSHSDGFLLENPRAESLVRQGITTVVMGSCGMSAAPLFGEYRPSASIMPAKLKWDWRSVPEYLDRLESTGVSLNVIPLVGHGNIRGAVKGYGAGDATASELTEMKRILAEALDGGTWGMSSGLIYPPGSFTSQGELVALLGTVHRHGGVYHTHIRGQGENLLAAMSEAIDTARVAQVPLHVFHHKGMGDGNAPKVRFTLAMVDEALAEGLDVTLDMYPYHAGQGGLGLFVPPWAHEGGPTSLVERLRDSRTRARLRREMMEPSLVPGYQSYVRELGPEKCWDHVLICECSQERNKPLAGRSLAQARPAWKDPFDFVFDLLVEEGGDVPVVIPDYIDLDDTYLQMVLRHPVTMFGSDGYALAPYGPLGEGVPHPRSYGTFPRVLGRFVRERKLFTWQEAIRKMTSLPARFLGLKDRGAIRVGNWADLVIFDPERIIDRATFMEPHQYPEGIAYVVANGVAVVKDGEHTDARPGHVLRSGGKN
jgi:N-acyl-D-amino-acid deacylase